MVGAVAPGRPAEPGRGVLSAVWTSQDGWLLLWAGAAIAVIVALVTWARVHPFLALVLGSGFLGLATGMTGANMVRSFQAGAGSTLGGVGVIVALGAVLGLLLAESGGADRIVDTLLGWSGRSRAPWLMTLVAMVVGVPLFFETGLVLLLPVVFLMSRRESVPVLRIGVPALAGLSVLHGLVPPHPGPLIAVDALHADLGRTLLFGLLVAVPTVLVAGPLFAPLAVRWTGPTAPPVSAVAEPVSRDRPMPGFGRAALTVLLPVALMLVRMVAELLLPAGDPVRGVAHLLGEPVVALTVSTVVALLVLGPFLAGGHRAVADRCSAALAGVGSIVLVIGAGGGFKQLLIASGIGEALASAAGQLRLPVLLLGWLVAVVIRLATGSATVATITAAGILAPLAATGGADPALLALAIGSGSLFFSHVNDAGFWLVKESFGLSLGQTLKSWSVLETLISVVSLAGVLVLDALV